MIAKPRLISLAICTLLTPWVHADTKTKNDTITEEMVITGVKTETPLTIETDPKAPRQPLPAQDGADYLKTIPGFSVIRKGGTSGDPVFRGMAGSRLSLLLDGDLVLGGCGSRMDPPTAYVFPETYDRIRLVKGPQTVIHGPGNSAGVVLFERDRERLAESGWKFHSSLLGGSFGRDDEVIDLQGGTPDFYLRGMASHSQQDNYEDGDGNEVHSQYDRWNTNLALGWTPSDDVTVEINGSRSDAEAAYADRSMDGSQFARDNISAKVIVKNLSPVWKKLETQVYYNYVDHVMDNYSLRKLTGMTAMQMASNPDRQTEGARVLATLNPISSAELIIGADTQTNDHTNRSTSNQMMMPYQDMPRVGDAHFEQLGIFGEWTQTLTGQQRVIGGLRLDDWSAEDQRAATRMIGNMQYTNPTAGKERNENLSSGFLRYEKDVHPITLYTGIGHSERFPDYWELISKESLDSISAFNSKPEETTQLDIGAIYTQHKLKSSVSVFYSEIDNYLLIQSRVNKPVGATGSRVATVTRNVDASTWGLEADISYAITDSWRTEASLASTRGTNETDDTHLSQIPPLELRLGLNYTNPTWSAGVFWRVADDQTRVDINKGNIAGQDIGASDGFNVLSFNAGWRAHKNLLITSGIDNLLNETYAEHISKAGAMIAGYDQTTRINEPGRTYWLKAQLSFE
ncbi:TonB-dependent copper receptor [Cellvibrio sp. pealriver]|uniref:TonB-dependent copper receptor n=1 Tax=Cellvibrio sp. pealriver TaxID=1622269 RepID=UPI00066FF9FD|nr:TonB-dependent copper receptor [Cellvibrio sp. pealriver]